MPSKLIRQVIFGLIIGSQGVFSVLAQNTAAGANVLTRTQVSFLLIAGAKPPPESFVAQARGQGTPVMLGTFKSALVSYEGPAQLLLYAPDAKSKDGRSTLATVSLPAKSPRVLVLLAPGGGPGSVPYSAVAVDDDVSAMPAGSLRFLNYSGKTVAVQIGKETLNLGKGPSKAFPIATQSKDPVEVVVQVASQEPDGFARAFSSLISVRADERQTFILLPPAKQGGRGIKVTPLRDVVVQSSPKDQRSK